jgi:hypothetical protein
MASILKPRRNRLSKAQRRQRQTRQARIVRRRLRALHDQLPGSAQRFVDWLLQPFTRPTAVRLTLLLCAGLLTIGNHTVLNLLRTLGPLVPGDSSSYRRVYCAPRTGHENGLGELDRLTIMNRFWKPEDGSQHRPSGFPSWG